MPPYTTTITAVEEETTEETKAVRRTDERVEPKGYKGIFGEYKTDLIWLHITSIALFHVVGAYVFLTFPYFVKYKAIIWATIMGGIAGFGVTAGAHRYWCHRSYKATMPLQIFLMICYSAAGQNRIFDWVRDHRVHHKFSETDADPHNSNRGFFFSHMGWLWMRKHPEVYRRGREVDMSDIYNDPLIQFHEKYFHVFRILFCFLLPTAVPVYFWDESLYHAVASQCVARYILSLHFTWLVNSAAHMFGNKPYDTKINPRENLLVALVSMGEGWHNYHHTFPWDYKASELGRVNFTLFWLNQFAKIGWAYDLKTPSPELVRMVIERRGPQDHHHHGMPQEVPESEDMHKSF